MKWTRRGALSNDPGDYLTIPHLDASERGRNVVVTFAVPKRIQQQHLLITRMFGTLGRAAMRGLTGVRSVNMLAAPQAPPAQVFTKIFPIPMPSLTSLAVHKHKIAEVLMIATGAAICAAEANMFLNRNTGKATTATKHTAEDEQPKAKTRTRVETYPWIGMQPGYHQGF
ncbi:uncharacterized protein LOC144861394 [Branchiostoma floridae x Branchiostoma japonicum]